MSTFLKVVGPSVLLTLGICAIALGIHEHNAALGILGGSLVGIYGGFAQQR